MIPDKIKEIIEGKRCPKCGSTKLYVLLYDYLNSRFKCANCSHRYTPSVIDDDFQILRWFSKEYPAHLTKKLTAFSYNTVYNKYMKFRQEILEYADNKNIPKRPPISEIRKIPKDKGLTGFKDFARRRLSKIPRISKNHLPFYQRELEFRYHYRNTNIKSLIYKIYLNTLKQP